MGKFTGHTITSDSVSGSAKIERSVRFNNADGQVLQRTPSVAGNRKKWTFSAWIKRSKLEAEQRIFGGKANASHIYFASNDELTWDLANVDSGSASGNLNTQQVFRDISGWYHLVCALDTDESTANNRMRMYINGTELTGFGTRTNPSSGYATNAINDTSLHTIGRRTSDQGSDGMRFDGDMAEINFIDGQQYDPSYFGFTDGQTNIWMPKRYVGSYGTNGFRLDFNDNSSTTALSIDKSPNGNDFANYNFSVSAGAGNDSVIDSPTNNFCTWNSSFGNPGSYLVPTDGNLQCNGVSGNNHNRQQATKVLYSGKWYCELKMVSGYSSADGTIRSGVCTPNAGHRTSNNDGLGYENSNNFTTVTYAPHEGVVYEYTTSKISSLTTFANGDVMGIALDLDNDRFFVSKNGTFFSNGTGTQDPVTGTNPLYSGGVLTSRKDLDGFVIATGVYSDKVVTADFGQQGFAYTPPTGFKAISSKNFVPSTPAFRNPKRHFDIVTFTGNGSTGQSITSLQFQPDVIWFKSRSNTRNHTLWNSVMGRTNATFVDATNMQFTSASGRDLASFDPHGFTVGEPENSSSTNANGETSVAWCWKGGGNSHTYNIDGVGYATAAAAGLDGGTIDPTGASINTQSGLSILTYNGSGSETTGTIAHGLGKVPKWCLFKRRDASGNWMVYHASLGNTHNYYLNTSDTSQDDSHAFADTSPTSSLFTLGISAFLHYSSGSYIAYLWTDIPGFSKFGSYVGNGNSNGQYVYLGFRPAYILIKRNASESWIIADFKRNSNDRTSPADSYLLADTSGAESTGIIYDLVQNGVKFQSNSQNESGSVYHYAAFADSPGITPFGGATANAQ